MTHDSIDVQCAKLTAAGRGAIAVVAIAGDYKGILSNCFQPANGKQLGDLKRRKIVYGIWKSTGEDVIVYCRTGKLAEVHCHGGTAAVDAVLASLVSAGANQIDAKQFCQRNRSKDIWQRGVREALQAATTERVAALLVPQLKRLPSAIDQIVELIERDETSRAIDAIESILHWSDFGVALTTTPSVVFCGQPNVGKSSLINAIAGFERAIVHDVPGTTRDVLNQPTAVAGWPIILKDTAGLRESEHPVERLGIEQARRQIKSAKLVIGIFDASFAWNVADQQLADSIDCNLIVHNKADIAVEDASRPAGLFTSAANKQGIPELIETIAALLQPGLPPDGQAFCVNTEQMGLLQQSRNFLNNGDQQTAANCLRHQNGSIQ